VAATPDGASLARSLRAELAARDAVLSAMGEGVLLFQQSGRLAFANRAARTMLGRRFESASEVSPRRLREGIRAMLEQVEPPPDGEPQTWQFETPRTVLEATAIPAGQPGEIVVVLRDVTRARSVERLRRDFVANASHELKTPVTSILALTEALRAASGDAWDGASPWLEKLEHEAKRLAALVRDLLALSRFESDAPRRDHVLLDHVVVAETDRLRPRAEAAGLRLLVRAHGEHAVMGSEPDLALLVHNLVDNAIRYTPDGGDVRVAIRSLDGVEELTVEDTGIGIPGPDLERIFERFYRVDPARSRQTGGTGLGLSIVRHVAQAHAGTVTVSSVLGSGSSFIVRLPAGDATARR